MSKSRIGMAVVALSVVTFGVGGCLDVEKSELRYDIEGDLTGKVTFSAQGVHSDRKTPAEREAEMAEFYAKDQKDFAAQFRHAHGLDAVEVTLSNKTATRCDAVASGEFDSILRALGPIVGDEGFHLERTEDRLTASFTIDKKLRDLTALSVAYSGQVLDHNAHDRDKASQLLTWNVKELGTARVRFVLATRGKREQAK